MNVTFHVLTGIAAAAVLTPRKPEIPRTAIAAGLGLSAALHGLLDYVPHTYPINSRLDVALALLLFVAVLYCAHPRTRPLLAACFLGSILPDLVDLTAGILNRHAGLHLPQAKVFPWHWKRYSGSVYNTAQATPSARAHLLVVAITVLLIWRSRDRLFTTAEPRT